MNSPIAFFCRCRPQESDAINIVLEQKRVFIGYAAWRPGKYLQDHDFCEAILDLSSPDQDQEPLDRQIGPAYQRQISANRRLVREMQRWFDRIGSAASAGRCVRRTRAWV